MKKSCLTLLGFLFLASCAILRSAPPSKTVQQRLRDFPASALSLKLKSPSSRVYFNDNLVPYIVADNDEDAAFLLGATHSYLRAFQMELLRFASQGRVSEILGPFTRDIDHALRIFNFSKRSQDIIAQWPDSTRLWMDSYLEGLNEGIAHTPEPFECRSLGIKPSPWTMADLVTLTRLLSADVNWIAWIKSFRAKNMESVWLQEKLSSKEEKSLLILEALFIELTKSGSNSWAVAGRHSKSGSALMANDPHVGILYPNLWFLYGLHSPSFKVAGMGFAGVPFVLLGRNPWISWGGTNMRALSTEFYDVSELPHEAFQTRTESLGVRWWWDREVQVRETEFGPVLSDAKIFKSNRNFSVKWMGHEWSDELSAFYKVNKAQNFEDFRKAFETYGVSAQNFLYADQKGNIGHVLAMRLPKRKMDRSQQGALLPIGEEFRWQGFVKSPDLPYQLNPKEGILASANNRPLFAPPELGLFFSPPDRYDRILSLFSSVTKDNKKLGVEDMKRWQEDVYSRDADLLKNLVLDRFDLKIHLKDSDLVVLREWDGRFEANSRGALVYSCVELALIRSLPESTHDFLSGSSWSRRLIQELLSLKEGLFIKTRFEKSLSQCASGDLRKFKTWGDKHPVSIPHPFSNLPLVGESYRFHKKPAAGSFDTLMKRAHSIGEGVLPTSYGATARHVSDLGDPDANFFVLYGGQDAWVGSEAGVDQALMWERGEWIQIPLTLEKALVTFKFAAFASE